MTFYSPSEVRAAFPQLDPDAAISLSQFSSLITDYRFKKFDFVRCQLENEGHVCGTLHGYGHIGVRADGVIGWIGNVCAKTHGKSNAEFAERWRLEAERVAREKRIAESASRIASYQATEGLRGSMQADIARAELLLDQISIVRRSMPRSLLVRLADMVKRGNRRIDALSRYIDIEVDKDGRKREITRWEPFVLGIVDSPDGLDSVGLKIVGDALKCALAALETAVPNSTADEEKLRAWAESLDGYSIAQSALDAADRAFQLFRQDSNLKLLPWLVQNGNDQDAIATYLLKDQGKPHQPHNAQSAMGTWRYEIEQREGGRPFRLA